jgi:hypothetical protein
MIRAGTILLFLSLVSAACAHDHALQRRDIGEMKNDSPAISPWSGPVPENAVPQATGATDIVEQVREMAVQVVARGGGQKISVATGVLAGGGIVFTDLRALLLQGPGGALEPPREIAVVTARGVFPARLAGAVIAADLALLELPAAARGLEGPPVAEGPVENGDRFLAIRAAEEGADLTFEVTGFSLERAEGPARQLEPAPALPARFAGAPVFDFNGELAGLAVRPSEGEVLLVPASVLLEILDRLQPTAPQQDDHI